MHEKYQGRGLAVLGFPCNQFLSQDPGSDQEISQFCELNYGVTFPMFAKIDVNGDEAHPLFKHLTSAAPGLLGMKAVKWNFTKFLVDRNGRVVSRYAPQTKPEDIAADIEKGAGRGSLSDALPARQVLVSGQKTADMAVFRPVRRPGVKISGISLQ